MKHILFRILLKSLRQISLLVQIGNPAGRAPQLIEKPDDTEKLRSVVSGLDDVAVWHLHKVICCVSLYHHVSLSHGVVVNEHNQVYSRFIHFPWGNDVHPVLSLPYLGRKSLNVEKAILLMTPEAKGNYYHWIADLLPRLLLVEKQELFDFDDRIIILHNPPRRYETDTLALLGIKQRNIVRINPLELVEVDDLVVADYINYGEAFPIWKKQLLDDFKNKIHKSLVGNFGKKLYLLRGNQSKRRLIGEENLSSFLQNMGFQILNPDQMTLLDQVHALANADVVIALHGAALTNIIFCKESTLVIELRSTNNPPEYFSEIAKTYNLIFESISIPPERTYENIHISNKQNLILTEQSIDLLKLKLDSVS